MQILQMHAMPTENWGAAHTIAWSASMSGSPSPGQLSPPCQLSDAISLPTPQALPLLRTAQGTSAVLRLHGRHPQLPVQVCTQGTGATKPAALPASQPVCPTPPPLARPQAPHPVCLHDHLWHGLKHLVQLL